MPDWPTVIATLDCWRDDPSLVTCPELDSLDLKSLALARRYAEAAAALGFPPPTICAPTADGTVSMEFRVGDAFMEFEFSPNHCVLRFWTPTPQESPSCPPSQ